MSEPPDSRTPYRVDVPLEGGRTFTCWLPKPPSQLSPVEIEEIRAALMRHVSLRGKA